MQEIIVERISRETGIDLLKVSRSAALLDEGNTVPFLARYRKEMTGGLTDEELRLLQDRLVQYRNLEKRRQDVMRLINSQEALTPELQKKIELALTVTELDDLYRPYRPRKRTRASVARERGLEPLALLVIKGRIYPQQEALSLIDPGNGLLTAEDVLKGVSDIIAEIISDDAAIRKSLRNLYRRLAVIEVKKNGKAADNKYNDYENYSEPVSKIKDHRVLAINRGVKEKALDFKLIMKTEAGLKIIGAAFLRKEINEPCTGLIREAAADSINRLIHPSLERELWQALMGRAVAGALLVFRANLKKRLLVSPARNRRVLGWDPGFRTGCKLAAVTETGRLLETAAIFPTAPRNDRAGAKAKLKQMLDKHQIDCIAIGNGTASRESEIFVAETIKEASRPVEYTIVNEAGASVYSASPAARKEFPDLDVAERSAVSIARRLQDPLAELVKIDPKAIGVGQYQHDMPAKELDSSLSGTVENCVNSVGVELNNASAELLSYVAGINSSVAGRIVEYRNQNGSYKSRIELLKLTGLGPKVFKQCAGFLRLPESENYLERSAVHPESYSLAEKMIERLGLQPADLGSPAKIPEPTNELVTELAAAFDAGEPTVRDILEEFRKPGRDPREDLPKPVFMKTVIELDDLEPGMVLKGIVRNIVDFGAFIDIGVHHDGLVHISEIADRYIKHPLDALQLEEVVTVKILTVDQERNRIALSIRQAAAAGETDHHVL
jgi:protein Tex